MTITKHAECENISVTSTNLDDTNQSVSVEVTLNCDSSFDLTFEVEETTLVITPELLEQESYLKDGVYNIKLTIVQDNGDTITESKCIFLNCGTKCKIYSSISTDITPAVLYEALVSSESCATCSCADMCTLFNKLTKTCNDDSLCNLAGSSQCSVCSCK